MGNQANQQQGRQVYYDSATGQYYTQTPKNNSIFAGIFGDQLPAEAYNDPLMSIFSKGGQRTYLNNLNQRYNVPINNVATPVPTLDAMFGSSSSLLDSTQANQATDGGVYGAGRFL